MAQNCFQRIYHLKDTSPTLSIKYLNRNEKNAQVINRTTTRGWSLYFD